MRHVLADCLPEPVLHLPGGLAIEGEKHQLVRADAAVALEKDRACHERARLPAPGARRHENVAARRRDRGGLVEVERFLQFRLDPSLDETRADVLALCIVQQHGIRITLNDMFGVQEVGTEEFFEAPGDSLSSRGSGFLGCTAGGCLPFLFLSFALPRRLPL